MRISAFLTNVIAPAAIAASLVMTASQASAAVTAGSYAGKTKAEIAETLERQGYTVRKVETEDGYLEAYALLDGVRLEIYVDPATGKVVKIEEDD